MFLFTHCKKVPLCVRQKPRARAAGVLSQQNDRKPSPSGRAILKTTRKRGFFMCKREILLLRALSKQPDPAGRHACVRTVGAERCFCLRTIKRERQSARPGFFIFTNPFPPIKNAPLRGVGKNQTATLVNYILVVFHYTTVGAFPAEPFAKPNNVFRGGAGNFAAQAA